jgi:hypothetical protein
MTDYKAVCTSQYIEFLTVIIIWAYNLAVLNFVVNNRFLFGWHIAVAFLCVIRAVNIKVGRIVFVLGVLTGLLINAYYTEFIISIEIFVYLILIFAGIIVNNNEKPEVPLIAV